MAVLDLDSKFGFIAGDPALDLVNTVHWRRDDALRYDALEDYRHLLRWAQLSGLLNDEEAMCLTRAARVEPERSSDALRETLVVREALHAAASGRTESAEELSAAFRCAQQRGVLTREENGWAWIDGIVDLRTPLDRIARAAVTLLTASPQPIIAECADEACGWLFIDTSRRRNRRWCSAAGCGDRNRARRYYRRHNGIPSSDEAAPGVEEGRSQQQHWTSTRS